jgi:hypothetical protein
MALYIDREEFVHPYDERFIREKGVDAFLGHILKISKDEYEQMNKSEEVTNEIKQGNSEKLLQNPGNVTYADIKAFMEKKNAERLNNQS